VGILNSLPFSVIFVAVNLLSLQQARQFGLVRGGSSPPLTLPPERLVP